MRVADGQVVETPRFGATPGDGEVRLMAFDVEGLAVDQADPDALVAGFPRRQLLRQVALSRVGRAGIGEHHGVVADRQLPAGTVHHMDEFGQPHAERVARVIHRRRRQRVVVSGQQHHRSLPVAPGELAECAAPPFVRRRRLIEQVAGAKHGVDVAARRHVEYPVEHLQAGAGEEYFLVAPEGRETAPEMPVGGMQQLQRHVAVTGIVFHADPANTSFVAWPAVPSRAAHRDGAHDRATVAFMRSRTPRGDRIAVAFHAITNSAVSSRSARGE